MNEGGSCGGGCRVVTLIAKLLLIVGGINWGLAVFDYNLVNVLVGQWPVVEDVVYGAVGVAAIYLLLVIIFHKGCCKKQ